MAVAAALLAACTGTGDAPSDTTNPVHLTLTTYDNDQTAGAELVHRFVDEARTLDSSIHIAVQFHGSPTEADAVTSVSNGGADLVMVASRAFDTAGVTTLQALNAPLLIDSSALASAVATSDLVPSLLRGLDGIGVQGLAIAPEGMRHVFGRKAPPVDVQDLQGKTVRSPQSQAVWAFFADMGATAIFDETRTYDFAESQLDQSPLNTTVGNLTLFAKYDVIAINSDAAKALSARQLRTLKEAATKAADWARETVANDAQMAKAFCDNGGEIATATQRQLQQWRTVAERVTVDLRSTPTTGALIDAIAKLKERIPPGPPPAACPRPSRPPTSPAQLNGTYTYTITPQALSEVGIHDRTFIDENAGEYTVVLRNGEMEETQRYTSGPKAGSTYSARPHYILDGDTITIRWSAQPNDRTMATVAVLADGSLTFSDWIEGMHETKHLLLDQVNLKHWKRKDPR